MTPDSSVFLIVGHRGAPPLEPENTLASVRAAFRAGADGVEVDARLLADQSAVLFHDDEFGGRVSESLSLSDLRQSVPAVPLLLELAEFSGPLRLTIEVKRAGWEDLLQRIVRDFSHPPIISSFDHRVVARLHRLGYSGPLGVVFSGYPLELQRLCVEVGAGIAYPAWRYVDAAMVSDCRSVGVDVVPWTVNAVAAWQHLHAIGCRGVITDFPDEAVRWRAAVLKC